MGISAENTGTETQYAEEKSLVYIRFCTKLLSETDERRELEVGPFPFVQLTYEVLRIGPDGLEIAYFDEEEDAWLIAPEAKAVENFPFLADLEGKEIRCSDVIIAIKA